MFTALYVEAFTDERYNAVDTSLNSSSSIHRLEKPNSNCKGFEVIIDEVAAAVDTGHTSSRSSRLETVVVARVVAAIVAVVVYADSHNLRTTKLPRR